MMEPLCGFDSANRRGSIALNGGRVLAWHEWGPSEGMPVLFCTGAAMSGRLGFGTDHVDTLKIRLIAPDRPGLGGSSAHPSKTLLTWADDIRAFFADQRISRAAAVGFSQGAPFAFTLAGCGLVERVAIVSGQDDLANAAMQDLLPPEIAALVQDRNRDSRGFEDRFAQMATADGMWDLIVAFSSAHDRALYTQGAFQAAYRECLSEGFAQGAQGYARDLVNALGRWPLPLEEIRVPVDLWYGGLDASPVHSPDFGATLARRLPQAIRFFEPQAGGSILWTHARQILARLSVHG